MPAGHGGAEGLSHNDRGISTTILEIVLYHSGNLSTTIVDNVPTILEIVHYHSGQRPNHTGNCSHHSGILFATIVEIYLKKGDQF